MKSPNILFILSDQHNAKVLGCKGHPDVQTPHLDRMAAEGVRFENAIAQNPICTPSRMCYLSGQYCHNHGYYGLSGPNPGGLPTVLGHFRRAGYRTAAMGKIHCPEYWVEDDSDVYHETCEGCSVGGISPAYAKFNRDIGHDDGQEHYGLPEFGKERACQSMEGRPGPRPFAHTMEGWLSKTAIEFMRESATHQKSFFCHVSLPRPHQTTSPAPEFWNLYDDSKLHLPPNADYDMTGQAPHLRATANGWRVRDWTFFEPKTFEAGRLRKLHGYLGAVSQVDHAVGQMLEFLRTSGLGENTLVIYSSDHGDYACEHGIMEKAPGICHDAITRVPAIWWWPSHFKAGHVADEIVETVDLAPTVSALAGLDPLETSDGRNISHLLSGGRGDVHRVGVTEFAWSKSLRKGPYRLVYYPPEMFADEYPEGFGELYNLMDDPWEMHNLYFEADQADVVRDLRNELLNWLVTTTRPRTALAVNSRRSFSSTQSRMRYEVQVNLDGKVSPEIIRQAPHQNYL
jgi:arylsulfatase